MRVRGCVGLALFFVSATSAAAPDADTCMSSYEKTQRLRRDGKLIAAENEALVCSAESCAAWMRKDCGAWLEEIRAATPTLTVSAIGTDGCDLTSARVTIDGASVAEQLDGRAVSLDPGSHVVRVEAQGQAPVERTIVLAEGEKAKRHVVRFAPEGVACGAVPTKEAEAPKHKPPLVPIILGGVGLAAALVGGAFYVRGLSQKSTLDDCRPRCATDDVDKMRTTFLVGDVLVGAGIITVGVAAILFLTSSPSAAQTGLWKRDSTSSTMIISR